MRPALRRACLGCRFPLEVTAADRCPECGRAFDPSDCATYGVRLDRPVALTVVRNAVDGELLRARLAAEGIMAACETLRALSWGAEMREIGCRVHVDASDADAAREILERDKATVAGASTEDPDWTCGGCGEQVDGVFAACWKCGAARRSDESAGAAIPAWRAERELDVASPTQRLHGDRRVLETVGAAALAIAAIRTAFEGFSGFVVALSAGGLACFVPAARRWWRRGDERRLRRAGLADDDEPSSMK